MDEALEEIQRLTTALQDMRTENTATEKRLADQEEAFNQQLQHERSLWEERLESLERALSAVNQAADTMETPNSPSQETGVHSVPINVSSPQPFHIPISQKENEKINVQVEHIVRGDREQSYHRIRSFSGNEPKKDEVDFDEWSKQVELMMEDESVSSRAKRQKILSSLHTPALDLARGMGDISAEEMFKRLEELYGTATTGSKLLHEFFKMQCGMNEKPADYLQRLSIKIQQVVKKGALRDEQVDETILTHFKATCLDDRICNVIHVKYDSLKPPTFQDLMREVKRTGELNIQNKHDQSSRSRSHVQQTASPEDKMHSRMDSLETKLKEFTTSINSTLQAILASQKQDLPFTTVQQPPVQHQQQVAHNNKHKKKRSPRICFNCGISDGHMSTNCTNPSNPTLVHRLLNEKSSAPSAQQNNLNGRRPPSTQ